MADLTAAGRWAAAARRYPESVEGRSSWVAAGLAIAILSISYGAPLVGVIALKPIAAALGAERSTVALAAALVWVGTGLGGILMGWVADRVGVRRTVIFGAVMTALGLAVSSLGRV
jgi:MFS family permease